LARHTQVQVSDMQKSESTHGLLLPLYIAR